MCVAREVILFTSLLHSSVLEIWSFLKHQQSLSRNISLAQITHDFSYSSNTSVNMNNIPALEWVVEIYELYLTARSFRFAFLFILSVFLGYLHTIDPQQSKSVLRSDLELMLAGSVLQRSFFSMAKLFWEEWLSKIEWSIPRLLMTHSFCRWRSLRFRIWLRSRVLFGI